MSKGKVFLLIAAISAALSGCGVGDVGGGESAANTSSEISTASYDDSLEGLCAVLLDNGCISGEAKETLAGFIHAEKGLKYQFKVNKSFVSAEVYDYGKSYNLLDESARKIIEEARNSGKIVIAGEEFPAVASQSGRYLMIYNDASSDKNNAEKSEKAKEIVKKFKE